MPPPSGLVPGRALGSCRDVNPILGPGHLSSHARPGLSSNRLAAINPWIRSSPGRSAIARATGLFCPTIYRILAEDCDASSGFSDGGSVGKVVCGTGPVYAPDEGPNFSSENIGEVPMKLPRFRFTIRTMMILALISAVILTLCGLVSRAVDPLPSDRAGTLPGRWIKGGVIRHFAVVALGTAVAATPFVIAIILALKTPPRGRAWRRKAVRWLGVAISLACGFAILDYPLDGLRLAWLLRDRTGVAFYHQYRIWPGAHITPCLELVTPTGTSRSYPIARKSFYPWWPTMRTDAEQTIVWIIDYPKRGTGAAGVVFDQSHDRRLHRRGRTLPGRREPDLRLSTPRLAARCSPCICMV